MPDFAFYSTDIEPTTDPANADPAPETLVVLDQVPILGNAAYDLMAGEIGRGAVIQTLGGVVIQDFGVVDGDQRISFSDSDALSADTVADLRTIHETADGEYFLTNGYDIWRVRFARPGGFKYRRNLFWAQHSQEIYSYEINLIVMASLRLEIADCGLSLETAEGLFGIADCGLSLETAEGLFGIADCKLPLEAAAWFTEDPKLPLEAAAEVIADCGLSLEAVEAGFAPTGTPVAHWSANTIIGLEDGDPVGTWPDQSGNGNDLVQADADKKPTYETNEINTTLPVVRYEGTDDTMAAAALGLEQTETVFFVIRVVASNLHDCFIDGTNNLKMAVHQSATGNVWKMNAGTTLTVSNVATVGSWGIYTATYKGAASDFRYNGSSIASGNVGAGNADGFTIGSRGDGTYCSQIDVAEIIVYNGEEPPTNNEDGLNTKYAIH